MTRGPMWACNRGQVEKYIMGYVGKQTNKKRSLLKIITIHNKNIYLKVLICLQFVHVRLMGNVAQCSCFITINLVI